MYWNAGLSINGVASVREKGEIVTLCDFEDFEFEFFFGIPSSITLANTVHAGISVPMKATNELSLEHGVDGSPFKLWKRTTYCCLDSPL